jgi:hypothetical protein
LPRATALSAFIATEFSSTGAVLASIFNSQERLGEAGRVVDLLGLYALFPRIDVRKEGDS